MGIVSYKGCRHFLLELELDWQEEFSQAARMQLNVQAFKSVVGTDLRETCALQAATCVMFNMVSIYCLLQFCHL